MKKLSLNLDALQVESFDTGHDESGRGTVMGLQLGTRPKPVTTDTGPTYEAGSCNGGVCTNDYSCQESWADTCQSDPMTTWTTGGG